MLNASIDFQGCIGMWCLYESSKAVAHPNTKTASDSRGHGADEPCQGLAHTCIASARIGPNKVQRVSDTADADDGGALLLVQDATKVWGQCRVEGVCGRVWQGR
jgi:hypothetical protein